MEHRWGERMEMDLPVLLYFGGVRRRNGRLRDISISGCRVTLAGARFEQFSSAVDLTFTSVTHDDGPLRLIGSVVRRTPRSLGIEWIELSPPGVAYLMQRRSPPLADSAPTGPPPLYR